MRTLECEVGSDRFFDCSLYVLSLFFIVIRFGFV